MAYLRSLALKRATQSSLVSLIDDSEVRLCLYWPYKNLLGLLGLTVFCGFLELYHTKTDLTDVYQDQNSFNLGSIVSQ